MIVKRARDYQEACFSAIREAYANGKRGVMTTLATGLGKTCIFTMISGMVRTKGGRVLILVNRDVLCDQAAAELVAYGLHPVIERGQDKASPMSDLVVGSIQTLSGKRLEKWNKDHFKLVICDECHGSAAKTFKAVLDHFQSAYHLGVTATPNRHDKAGLWKGYQEIVFEMPLASRIESDGRRIAGGIDEGWLCPLEFRELPVPITLDDYAATKKSITEAEESAQFEKDGVLTRIFDEGAKMLQGMKSLCFFPNCKSSEEAAKAFCDRGLDARHIEGYQSTNERAKLLQWFKESQRGILCNADLLSVGFNQPDIQCVGMFRLCKSTTTYLQRLGRGTRPAIAVDGFANAAERCSAIAASTKPSCVVIDLMIQNEDHNLATPACLITDDAEEQKYLRQENKGKRVDLSEMEDKLRTKKAIDKEKALAKLAEDAVNAAKKKGFNGKSSNVTHNGVFIGHILNRGNNGKPASSGQLWYLSRNFNYRPAQPISAQQAYLLTERFKAHKKEGQTA
jgi:superfamily II DNA or RNA helicase